MQRSFAHPMRWQLIIYRLPSTPSRTRVAVWRELRRLGALPLQQAVSIVPELGDLVEALDDIEERIRTDGGTVYRFTLNNLAVEQRTQLESDWTALREHEFAEIIEECETKFKREIEFEIFRDNLTASEAEEIEADLEKIQTWFERVSKRDWFGAPNRDACASVIAECERLLDDFIERVYEAETQAGPSLELPPQLAWHDSPRSLDRESDESAGPDDDSADEQDSTHRRNRRG
jgi:Protein ChrB, N-terminal